MKYLHSKEKKNQGHVGFDNNELPDILFLGVYLYNMLVFNQRYAKYLPIYLPSSIVTEVYGALVTILLAYSAVT